MKGDLEPENGKKSAVALCLIAESIEFLGIDSIVGHMEIPAICTYSYPLTETTEITGFLILSANSVNSVRDLMAEVRTEPNF